MATEKTVERHDSFGLVSFSRLQGDSGNLFGSSIRHHNFIRLRVSRAHRNRDLSRHWYGDDEELVEVDLSPTQFADLLTSMNCGVGVPCTLRYVNRTRMPDCPSFEQRTVFEDEFKADVDKATETAAKLMDEANAILAKPTVTKADRERLKALIYRLNMDLRDNLPFVQKQFNKAMDKTVTEAKGEVDAFVQHRVVSLGIEALRDMVGGDQGGLLGEDAPAKRIESKVD